MTVEYHITDGHFERLPALAADLVRRSPSAIIAIGGTAALAAKAATPDIPIIFTAGNDPVDLGFVVALVVRAAMSRASPTSVSRLLKNALSCCTKRCRPLKQLLC